MVQPILASILLQAVKARGSEHAWFRIATESENIDEALRGGIQTGCVTAVSGERGTGKTLVRLLRSAVVVE